MPRRPRNKNIRNLTRIGRRSIGLTLPIDLVRELGWRERQKVVVRKVSSRLIITDWKKKAGTKKKRI